MHFSFIFLIELLGTAVFAISGAFLAMEKKLDVFGMLVLAFVTAFGGGTVRDMLIGNLPVTWLRDLTTPLVILLAAIAARLFKGIFHNLPKTLVFFDALGLGLFTVTGIQKGLAAGIHPALCVALGTITGCFGGVIRDLMVREIPVLFQRTEFYATACIVGGVLYFLLLNIAPEPVAQSGTIICICLVRILAVRYNWRLPSA